MMINLKSIFNEKSIFSIFLASFIIFVLSVIILLSLLFFAAYKKDTFKDNLKNLSDLRVISQQITTSALHATSGKKESFSQLRQENKTFTSLFFTLKKNNIKANGEHIKNRLHALGETYSALDVDIKAILSTEKSLLLQRDQAVLVRETVPQIQIEYDEIIELLLDNNIPADQVAIAQRQLWLIERLGSNTAQALLRNKNAVIAADTMGQDIKLFDRILTGMIEGNSAVGINKVTNKEAADLLVEAVDWFSVLQGAVQSIIASVPDAIKAQSAADRIAIDARQLLQQTSVLTDDLSAASHNIWLDWFISGAILVVFISMLIIGFTALRCFRNTHSNIDRQEPNNENQHAVTRLLEDLSELTKGNIAINATVTPGSTGKIANLINNTIQQLRLLVNTINRTVVTVDSVVKSTKSINNNWIAVSENQVNDINQATHSVDEITQYITHIMRSADDLSDITRQALQASIKGSQILNDKINCMSTIKEKINNTSQQIKKLDNPVQEISNHLLSLHEIIDQTNIVSINASIRASMAGETGHSFSLIAKEVEHLSTGVSTAITQIEKLITHMQMDKNQALHYIEAAMSEMQTEIQGAKDTKSILADLENASETSSKLIDNISNTTKKHSKSAKYLSEHIQVIRDITVKNLEKTHQTVNSIDSLSKMTMEMRQTVSDFRLKETES